MLNFIKEKLIILFALCLIPSLSFSKVLVQNDDKQMMVQVGKQYLRLNHDAFCLTPPVKGYTPQDWQNLGKLTRLTCFCIHGEGLNSLAGFPTLPDLYQITFERTSFTDISPLKDAPKLINLYLRDLKGNDITGLEQLSNLETLFISNAKIKDFSFLSKLTKVKFLTLSNTSFKDLTILQNLDNLVELDLSNTKVTDLSPLEKLPNLTTLKLNGLTLNKDAVKSLAALNALITLDLSDSNIADLSFLENFKNLKELILDHSQVTNLEPLKHIESLFTLSLAGLNLDENSSAIIGNFTKLDNLNLANSNITDLTFLTAMEDLSKLNLTNSKASDYSPISRLNSLYSLILTGATITDLEPIRSLEYLEIIALNETKIQTIAPLSQTTWLRQIDLRGTDIADISPLSKNNSIFELLVSNTKVTDLSMLTILGKLDIRGLDEKIVLTVSPYVSELLIGPAPSDNRSEDIFNKQHLAKGSTVLDEAEILDFVHQLRGEKPIEFLTEKIWPDIYGLTICYKPSTLDEETQKLCKNQTLKDLAISISTPLKAKDIAMLAQFSNLQKLQLINFDTFNAGDLPPLPQLVFLSLAHSNLNQNSVFNQQPKLKLLMLDNSNFDNVAMIKNFAGLEVLSLQNTPIKDISALSAYKDLLGLDLTSTPIENFDILSSFSNLQSLSLNNTKFEKLAILAKIKSLRNLNLENIAILDLTGFSTKNIQLLIGENTDRDKALSYFYYFKNLTTPIANNTWHGKNVWPEYESYQTKF